MDRTPQPGAGRVRQVQHRAVTWRLTIGALAGLVVAGLASPGSATASGHYLVVGSTTAPDGTPTDKVVAGSRGVFDVTFTNDDAPTSGDVLNAATITLPAGFTGISAPATFTDSSNGAAQTWSSTVSGSTVSVTSGGVGLLPTHQSVTVAVTATAPTALGGYTFATTASGVVGGVVGTPFANEGSDPSFTTYDAVYTCPAGSTCSFPRTGPDNQTSISLVDANGGTEDVIGVQAPSPVVPGCAGANNPSQPVAYETTDLGSHLSVTIYLPDSVVDAQTTSQSNEHESGDDTSSNSADGSTTSTTQTQASSYALCWQQSHPFTGQGGAAQPVATPAGTQFFGLLRSCTDAADVAPCLESITGWTDPSGSTGGLQFLALGTPGDPISIPTTGGTLSSTAL